MNKDFKKGRNKLGQDRALKKGGWNPLTDYVITQLLSAYLKLS